MSLSFLLILFLFVYLIYLFFSFHIVLSFLMILFHIIYSDLIKFSLNLWFLFVMSLCRYVVILSYAITIIYSLFSSIAMLLHSISVHNLHCCSSAASSTDEFLLWRKYRPLQPLFKPLTTRKFGIFWEKMIYELEKTI